MTNTENRERQRKALRSGRRKFAAHLAAVAVDREAQQVIGAMKRDARLQVEPGVALHIVRGQIVEVPTRREYPYGRSSVAVPPGGQDASFFSAVKTSLAKAMSAIVAGRLSPKEDDNA